MPRVFIHRELILRIDKHSLRMQLRGFITAIRDGHPPARIYKPSGVSPSFPPYQDLELHHHHLHRDGDPLLITQHVDDAVFGIALATHQTFFREDKMQWLKDHADVIDWSYCPRLHEQVLGYDPSVPQQPSASEQVAGQPELRREDEPPDDIPF
jgi:hypothetical protein